MSETPRFAVVGRVNKGKSSIIATLAEDDSVAVSPRPGTTTECAEFPVRVDGRELFVLVDTPGFEEASRALDWLKARETDAASRSALVAELVRAHEGTEEFVEERKLLTPIIAGASILYVVDGTKPYRANYEAEMEILRWTGRAGMALINRIGEGDHVEEWRRALDQYFKIVRDFDAFTITFTERMRILRVFRELRAEWAGAIDLAVEALENERRRRRQEAATIVRDLLVDTTSFSLEITVESESELRGQKGRLEERFHDALRKKEQTARAAIARLYAHRVTEWPSSELERPVIDHDLFAEKTWRGLGLSSMQIVGLWAVAGATVGGSFDAITGGASVLAGVVVGGTVGAGIGVFQLSRRFMSASGGGPLGDWIGSWSGTERFRIGPHAHLNFPFIVLDRALLHYQSVLTRTHARRDPVAAEGAESGRGISAALAPEHRRRLARLFERIRKRHDDVAAGDRDELFEEILVLFDAHVPESDSG